MVYWRWSFVVHQAGLEMSMQQKWKHTEQEVRSTLDKVFFKAHNMREYVYMREMYFMFYFRDEFQVLYIFYLHLSSLCQCTYVYTIPGQCPLKLEIAEVYTATPVNL